MLEFFKCVGGVSNFALKRRVAKSFGGLTGLCPILYIYCIQQAVATKKYFCLRMRLKIWAQIGHCAGWVKRRVRVAGSFLDSPATVQQLSLHTSGQTGVACPRSFYRAAFFISIVPINHNRETTRRTFFPPMLNSLPNNQVKFGMATVKIREGIGPLRRPTESPHPPHPSRASVNRGHGIHPVVVTNLNSLRPLCCSLTGPSSAREK